MLLGMYKLVFRQGESGLPGKLGERGLRVGHDSLNNLQCQLSLLKRNIVPVTSMESSVHRYFVLTALRDWLVNPDERERKETSETQESTDEMWDTFYASSYRQLINMLWCYSCEAVREETGKEGQLLSIFIDLCSIIGQPRTCRTERR